MISVDAGIRDRGLRDMDHRAIGQHGHRRALAPNRRLAEGTV
jgi:hypothetical protein